MHNLEHSIAEWRKTMMAAGNVSRETLDELENHLRENVDQLTRSGMPVPEAIQRAVTQLGGPLTIASEFQKLDQSTWWPIKLVIGIGATAAIVLAIVLIVRFDPSRSVLLLAYHVFSVTLGYTTTFLLGALGICFVGQRCLSDFSPLRTGSLTRVTFMLGCIAAVLTVVGVILGMLWAKAEWGRYWDWDPKEIGGLSVIAWLICFLAIHRLPRMTDRGVMVMSIMGNIVVSLAWFGGNLLSGLHSYGTPNYSWLLLASVLCNLALFLIGFAPAGWLRPGKA